MIWWIIGGLIALGLLDRLIRKRPWVGLGVFSVAALGFVGLVVVASQAPHRPSVRTGSLGQPMAAKPARTTPSAIWQAKTNTLACGSLKSIQAVQFLDALGRSQGVRNPASDASSQTDCMHLRRGTKLGIYQVAFAEGIASVHVPGAGVRYMLASDIEVGK